MITKVRSKLATICYLSALTQLCCACNPLYVIQAGLTQSEILWNRRSISTVVSDPETTPEIARKLELVTLARAFSQDLQLSPGGSFQSYSALDRDTLAWIVMAAKPDSFEFYTWWFPIVGSVPYKGYFSPTAANSAAKDLQDQGYETLVRGTEAFSTLGWFDDPVMTPMLKNDDHEIVNTVLHEIFHTTIWLPNFVAFNESLANFVGLTGAIAFYQQKLTSCPATDLTQRQSIEKELLLAQKSRERALGISKCLALLVPDLTSLYQSPISREAKISDRVAIFDQYIAPLKKSYPELTILNRAHNAELMQLQLYYTKLDLFAELWDNRGKNWSDFLTVIREVVVEVKATGADPFEIIRLKLR